MNTEHLDPVFLHHGQIAANVLSYVDGLTVTSIDLDLDVRLAVYTSDLMEIRIETELLQGKPLAKVTVTGVKPENTNTHKAEFTAGCNPWDVTDWLDTVIHIHNKATST